jgi:two-component sensor histidine kinase
LPDFEKTGGVKGYIFKDAKGKMYVAGNNYFIAFHPAAIKDVSTQPDVYVTDFKIFNTSYSHLLFEKEIKLKYNQNFFSIEFAAPGYQAGYPVQYAHKLEGVDKDWVLDGTSNSINYTNLDNGDYVFKVRATIRPGVWGEEVASLRIRINPPFWKTWWFYSLAALLISLMIYTVYRYRINELLKRQAIRNKIAQDLHDNVGSTLSSISVYSQVAKIYKEQNKMEPLHDTLEKISTTSSEMISEMNDIVWAINPRNDNMATILQRMESFARPLLASQEIKFHFSYEMSIQHQHLEMNKRKNFYLIFKESINNALKYSNCKNIWVEINLLHHHISLSVKDDGKGFDTKKARSANTLSGNGVQNMKMRAKEMKGNCAIESDPGKGTTILLKFPIP